MVSPRMQASPKNSFNYIIIYMGRKFIEKWKRQNKPQNIHGRSVSPPMDAIRLFLDRAGWGTLHSRTVKASHQEKEHSANILLPPPGLTVSSDDVSIFMSLSQNELY